MNPFSRLLRRWGRLPEELRAELMAGDVVLLEEGLKGSVTRRGYRAPGEYSSWSKQATAGTIALTEQRLVVWAEGSRHIDVPLAHPLRLAIEVDVERPDRVCFAYDAGATNPSRSGRVEVRLHTESTAYIAGLLQSVGQDRV